MKKLQVEFFKFILGGKPKMKIKHWENLTDESNRVLCLEGTVSETPSEGEIRRLKRSGKYVPGINPCQNDPVYRALEGLNWNAVESLYMGRKFSRKYEHPTRLLSDLVCSYKAAIVRRQMDGSTYLKLYSLVQEGNLPETLARDVEINRPKRKYT